MVALTHWVCFLFFLSALESGEEARIVQIDFSAAFDRVNHRGILYKLSSVGIGCFVVVVVVALGTD